MIWKKGKYHEFVNVHRKNIGVHKERRLKGSDRGANYKLIEGGNITIEGVKESIDDFLKPSITSSSVLKMIKGGKISIKKRRYISTNKGHSSKRRR